MANALFLASTYLQNDDAGIIAAIFSSAFSCICGGIIFLIVVAGLWKVFIKAGEPGWAAIIPIYNYYVILKIVERPWWWLLLLLVPIVNLIVSIIVAIDLAKSFGKDAAYGIILLWLLNAIGYLILGFGDAEYQGPAAAQKE
jgi:hypothetical protein